MEIKKSLSNLAFLSPFVTIRSEHLSKKDVRKIKELLSFKIGSVSTVTSLLLIIVNLVLFFIMAGKTNFDLIKTYGLIGVISTVLSILFPLICIVLELIATTSKNKDVQKILCRIGTDALFIGLSIQMILAIHADAEMGLLSVGEAVSPAIILFAVLMVIQPAFWTDAIILNGLAVSGVIGVSIYSQYQYDMQALFYYIVIAIASIFIDYIVVSTLFFAEAQRYCQVLRNERLYNRAMYDELTKCKNRYALRAFIKENQKRWETKNINLLVIMFDIDNFKEFNDKFSHPGGDYCLRSVADEIRKEFKSPNLDFYRYGGEEFLLFFEIRNPSDAKDILIQVRNSVRSLNIEAPDAAPKDHVTISVGGCLVYCPTDFNWNESLATVDKYLYQAKASGKDICCLDGEIIE